MLSNRAQTVETKEFTLVTLTKTFESEAPKKILAFDIDDTMLDCKMSELLHIPCIKREEELRKALYTAKKNEFLLVIVTSRSYAKQKQLESRPFLSIDNLLEKLGDDYFSGIYFTTNKHSALSDLSQRFNTKQVCLVDDMEFNRSPDFGFFQINDVDVYQRMHQFISPTTHTAPLLSEMKGSPLSLAASLENIPLLKTLVSFGDKYIQRVFSRSRKDLPLHSIKF